MYIKKRVFLRMENLEGNVGRCKFASSLRKVIFYFEKNRKAEM